MAFTDDDLKRLKDDPNHQGVHSCNGRCALLARLEDSEERLSAVAGVLHLIYARYKNDLRQNERAALESAISVIKEWRRAAGK